MPYLLGSPDAGVVFPVLGIMFLFLWVVVSFSARLLNNAIEKWASRRDSRRGFEIQPPDRELHRQGPGSGDSSAMTAKDFGKPKATGVCKVDYDAARPAGCRDEHRE